MGLMGFKGLVVWFYQGGEVFKGFKRFESFSSFQWGQGVYRLEAV